MCDYPGARPIAIKIIFRKWNGRLLGAQVLGEEAPAVDKRISTLAVARQMGATIYDLETAELCCAPGSAVRRIRSTSPGWSGRMSCVGLIMEAIPGLNVFPSRLLMVEAVAMGGTARQT